MDHPQGHFGVVADGNEKVRVCGLVVHRALVRDREVWHAHRPDRLHSGLHDGVQFFLLAAGCRATRALLDLHVPHGLQVQVIQVGRDMNSGFQPVGRVNYIAERRGRVCRPNVMEHDMPVRLAVLVVDQAKDRNIREGSDGGEVLLIVHD